MSIFQEISLRFDKFHVRLMKYEQEWEASIKVKNIQLAYEDFY